MDTEQRIEALEHEVRLLKNDIQATLLDIQTTLREKPAAPRQWQRKAWLLALLNMLMAVTLFANVHFYLPDTAPFYVSPVMAGWLRAFWIALAFVWLLLQMYPLALLFEQEDQQLQGVVWRNAVNYLSAHPAQLLALTAIVLVVALVNAIVPMLWFIIGLVLLVVVVVITARGLYDRARVQAK